MTGLRFVCALGLAALVVFFALAGFASTPLAQRWLLRRVSAWASERYGVAIGAARLDVSLARLAVSLHDVTVTPVATPDQPAVRAERLDLDLSAGVLLGRLAAERVVIVRPVVLFDSRVQKLFAPRNAGAGTRAGGRAPATFEVGRIDVRELEAAVRVEGLPDVLVHGLSSELHGAGPNRLAGTLAVAGGIAIGAGQGRVTFDRLDAVVELDGTSIALRALDARSPLGDVHVEGAVALAGAGRLDLRYRASATLDRLGRWWPESPAVAGRLDIRGTLAGPLHDPLASFEARGSGLTWAWVVDARFDASGRWALSEASGSHVSGTWAIPSLRVGGGARIEVPGTVELAWRGPLPGLDTVEGRLRASPRASRDVGADQGALVLEGRAGQWRLQGSPPLAGGTSAAADLTIDLDAARPARSTMVGTVTLRTSHVAALLAQARAFGMTVPAALDQIRAGRFVVGAAVSGTLDDPRLAADLTADGVVVGSWTGIEARGVVGADHRALSLAPLVVHSGGSRAELRGELPWVAPDGRGTIEARIDRLETLPLPLPEGWRPSGALSVSGQWVGSIRRPVVSAQVRTTPLAVAGLAFETGSGSVTLTTGRLEARDLHLRQGDGFLTGRVAWDIDSSAMEVEARAEGLEATSPWAGEATSAGQRSRTRLQGVSFDVRAQGAPRRLSGRASLSVGSMEIDGRRVGAVEATAEADDGVVHARGEAAAHRATAEGVVTLSEPWPYEARVDLRASDLAALLQSSSAKPIEDVDVQVTATIQASGALAEWRQSVLDVEVRSLTGEIRERRLSLDRPGRVRVQGGVATIVEPVRVSTGALALDVGGGEGPEAGVQVGLEGSVEDALALAAPDLLAKGWAAVGWLRAGLRVGLPFDAAMIRGDAVADLSSVTRDGRPVAREATLHAQVEGGTIRLSRIAGIVLDSSVTASATLPLAWLLPEAAAPAAGARPSTTPVATVALESEVAAGPMLALMDPGLGDVSGTLKLRLDAQAAAPRIDAVRATVVAERGELSVRGLTIAQQQPTRLRMEGGRVVVEAFGWEGPRSRLALSGSVGLAPGVKGDLLLEGRSALLALDVLLPGRTEGDATFDLRVSGEPDSRQVLGTVVLQDGSLLLPRQRLALAGWSGTFVLDAAGVSVRGLRGQFNGGEVAVGGQFPLVADAVNERTLDVTVRNAFLEFPRGLRSQFDAALTWRRGLGPPRLSGEIALTAETYREPITALASIVAGLGSATAERGRALPAWLSAAELDLRLGTTGPVTMSNSVGRVDLLPDLVVSGTVGRPFLRGQIGIVDDGRILIAGRTYRLSDSRLEFSQASGLVPRLSVRGETRVGDYAVYLRLSGPADEFETSLTSDPPLSERDLQSLLVTGQTADASVSGRTTDGFAIGAVSGDILGFAGQFIGLDSVRVGAYDDLKLMSSDVDPATRVTVSKRFGPAFELVLSDNLDDNELTWVVIYRPRPGYEFRLLSRDNLEYGLEFRQEVPFGPGVSPPRVTARKAPAHERVGPVTVSGSPGLEASEVLAVTRMREGDRFEFREWIENRDRIERLYRERGFYAARVVPSRAAAAGPAGERRIGLDYKISRGPRTVLQVSGYDAPPVLLDHLTQAWANSVLLDLLDDDLVKVAQDHLTDAGYLRAHVEASVEGAADVVTVLLRIDPGPRTSSRRLAFSGNTVVPSDVLLALAAEGRLDVAAWKDPAPLLGAIEAKYASQGYPGARATSGAIVFEHDTAMMPIRIDEGPEARVTSLDVSGVADGREAAVLSVLDMAVGSRYVTRAEQAARNRLERFYRNLGFRDVRVEARARVDVAQGRVGVTFAVTEGPRYVVRAVRTSGAQITRAESVARAITLEPGSPASPEAAADTQRRLYRLGTFRKAEVSFEPAGESPPAVPATVPVDAVVSVEESRRFLLLYGLETTSQYEPAFDQHATSLGAAVDVRDRNFLGRGWTFGAGMRYEPNFKSVRALFTVPRLGGVPVRTNVYAALTREIDTSAQGLRLKNDESVANVEQRWRPRGPIEVSWGYKLDRRDIRLFAADSSRALLGFKGWLVSLNSAVVFDRRDSMFDATRGWIQSTSAQWGLRALGSDFDYLRTLVRFSHYQPLGPLTLASNARWGNLEPLGGTPPLSALDLFFDAGGTQTVRGYKQDSLSAYQIFGVRLGGTRLLLLNEEIRFPLFWRLGGVVFGDAGNTFTDEGRIDLGDLAVGVGFGLRIRTPLAPLRIDVGFPVPRRPGDPLARWHFSIGQMF